MRLVKLIETVPGARLMGETVILPESIRIPGRLLPEACSYASAALRWTGMILPGR